MLDAGIEPALGPHLGHTVYKTVGASSYTNPAKISKKMGKEGFEPTKPMASDLQSEVTLQRYRLPKTGSHRFEL
jgi:hypothetical protein